MTTGAGHDPDAPHPCPVAADDFELAPFGYLVLLPDGQFLRANATFCRYLGHTPETLRTLRFRDVLTIPGRIFFETHLAPLLVLQASCSEVAFDFITRTGGRLPALANITAERGIDGQVTALRVGVFEATDRRKFEIELLEARRAVESKNKQLEQLNLSLASSNASLDRANGQLKELYEQMAAARASAEAANQVKTTFLAHMSHEIRTPLNGVIGMATLLHDALSDPAKKNMAAVIVDSGTLLLSIINDVLDLSKLEAGKIDLESIPFRLADLARKLSEIYTLKASEKSVAFAIRLDAAPDDSRTADPVRVMQILHNLVGNAVKFTEKGSVTVTIRARTDDAVALIVEDTGIGMTQEQADRIFEAFAQADSSTTRKYGGTGLGMSIVRGLVMAMGGQIEIVSALERGTRVEVTLPLPRVVDPIVAKPAETRISDAALAGLRVLAAEDNRTNQLVLSAILTNLGVRSTFVSDGAQAVAAYDPDAFDILFLDVSMPIMDGPTALALIRAQEDARSRPMIPVVAVTANALKHQVEEYLAQGFDAHLAKPISKADLAATLATVTARRPAARDRATLRSQPA
ncbi:MAG: ATP-binding protein [Gemmobacter sp.]